MQAIVPEIEVANAKPLNFIGKIKIVFNIIFKINDKNDILVGVTVSLRAKKHDCNILFKP